MKKNCLPIMALLAIVFLLNSCGEVEEISKYFTVNGNKIQLSSATIDDFSHNFYGVRCYTAFMTL